MRLKLRRDQIEFPVLQAAPFVGSVNQPANVLCPQHHDHPKDNDGANRDQPRQGFALLARRAGGLHRRHALALHRLRCRRRLSLLLDQEYGLRIEGRLGLVGLRGLLRGHGLIRRRRLSLLLNQEDGLRIDGGLRFVGLGDLLCELGLNRSRCLGLLLGGEYRLRVRGQLVARGVCLSSRCGLLLLRLLQSVSG